MQDMEICQNIMKRLFKKEDIKIILIIKMPWRKIKAIRIMHTCRESGEIRKKDFVLHSDQDDYSFISIFIVMFLGTYNLIIA